MDLSLIVVWRKTANSVPSLNLPHLYSPELDRLLGVIVDDSHKVVANMHLFRVAAWVRLSSWHQRGHMKND